MPAIPDCQAVKSTNKNLVENVKFKFVFCNEHLLSWYTGRISLGA